MSQSTDADELTLALGLYRGDLLVDHNAREAEFDDWLQIARAGLRKQAGAIATRLAALRRDAGQVDQAISVLEKLLWIDPGNESAHRDLISIYLDSGRRSEALRQYQDCVAALARELDARPGAQILRLLSEIRGDGTVPGFAASEKLDPVGRDPNPVESPLPRRLAAILYADVASYSHLTGEDEDATHRILSRYLDLFDARAALCGALDDLSE